MGRHDRARVPVRPEARTEPPAVLSTQLGGADSPPGTMIYRRTSDPATGEPIVEVGLTGYELVGDPLLNKGTAFTAAERHELDLLGLLPPHVARLEEQMARRYDAFRAAGSDLDKHALLRNLQDSNETLFYALVETHLSEMMPIIYTPTVGEACQRFSQMFRRPRGLFVAYPDADGVDRMLAHPHFDGVQIIVVTDGERILGLGDQGAGGMGIPIGKLSLYTACAGVHPSATLPILLDTGTDNPERLRDPLYLGWRHERVRGDGYDDFVERFVVAVARRWPHVVLQFEDFAQSNANRLLERYRGRLCTFNDDIQGTAAIAAGTLMAAAQVTGIPLREQRIAVLGAGSAGCGIGELLVQAMVADGLSEKEARSRFFLVDRPGLLLEDTPGLQPFQRRFAQPRAAIAEWSLESPGAVGLADVVRGARPTLLVGVSGQAGLFTEEMVREMARHVKRPVIFPLSNPTARAEATPADLLRWTEGRAVIGTGSPFAPVLRNDRPFRVDQTNNAYVFPGIGLGLVAAAARHVSDAMFMAAARAIAAASPARLDPEANLLPPLESIRGVSRAVAVAVAREAVASGLAEPCSDEELERAVDECVWSPAYLRYRRAKR
jgi:malate dehydrogenase (oxaloacetate-decarboxylating)